MKNNSNSFVFYDSFLNAINCLTEQDQLKAYKTICNYGLNGQEDVDDPICKLILCLIKPNIDKAKTRYNASVTNGKKGGRPRKDKSDNIENTQNHINPTMDKDKTVPNNLDKPSNNLTEPSANLNVDVNDNVYVNVDVAVVVDDNTEDNSSYEENETTATTTTTTTDINKILTTWNDCDMGAISRNTREIISCYLRKGLSCECIEYAIHQADESNVHNFSYIRQIMDRLVSQDIVTKDKLDIDISDKQILSRKKPLPFRKPSSKTHINPNQGLISHDYTDGDFQAIGEAMDEM